MKITPEMKAALGRVLTARRNASALTQEQLEATSGVPVRTIQRAESGNGISSENLRAIASIYGLEADQLMKEAADTKVDAPGTRLTLKEIVEGEALLRALAQPGSLQFGLEGEHTFNDHLGVLLLELGDAAKDKSPKVRIDALRLARELLAFCGAAGFRLFVGRHNDESVAGAERLPSGIINAAADSDPRIRRTPKGLVLDFLLDERRQGIRALMARKPTVYDWMEEQLVSRSDGEARVRFAMQQIHDDVRKRGAGKRRQTK